MAAIEDTGHEIIINREKLPLESIVNSEKDQLADPFTQSISRFCRQWLYGDRTFVLQTSGSTGKPKPISLSREQIVASARFTLEFFNLNPGDKILLCLNPEYIGGKMMLARAFVGNLRVFAIEPSSNPLRSVEKEDQIVFTAMVPLQLARTLQETPGKTEMLDRMKAIILGGGPVSMNLLEQIQRIKAPVYLTYGMTETVSHIALRRLNGPSASDFYQTIGDVEIGVDHRQCLTIKSVVTARRLLATNDKVEALDEKRFRWLGRIDHVINSGGIKFQVEELEHKIETILFQAGLTNRFFIFGLPDSDLGEKICLAIEGETPELQAVNDALRRASGSYEKPREIVVVNEFVETASGKIDRKKTIKKAL